MCFQVLWRWRHESEEDLPVVVTRPTYLFYPTRPRVPPRVHSPDLLRVLERYDYLVDPPTGRGWAVPNEILEYIFKILHEDLPPQREVRNRLGNIQNEDQTQGQRIRSYGKNDRRVSPPYMTNRLHVQQPALAAASTVCRRWTPVCEHLLYRDIVINRSQALYGLLRTLEARPEVRDTVQNLSFILPRSCVRKGLRASPDPDNEILQNIYRLCPKITVHEIGNAAYGPGRLSQVPPPRSSVVPTSALVLSGMAATLTRLEISNKSRVYIITCFPPFDFPALNDLVITGCYMKDYRGTFVHHLTGESVSRPTRFRWPQLPSLRRLALRDCIINTVFGLTFLPKLAVLEVFGGDIADFLEFICDVMSHRTLEFLSIVPASPGNRYIATPQYDDLGLDLCQGVVHLRVATSIIRLLSSRRLFPEFVQRLVIVDSIPTTSDVRDEALECIRGVLSSRDMYPELQRFTVVTSDYDFYLSCRDVEIGVNCRDVDVNIEYMVLH